MDDSLKRISKKLKTQLVPAALKEFKRVTPIDTGNARRSTRKRGKTIHARYDYASYLDKGHSKQAPKGMSEPVTQFLNKLVKKIMRK